MMIVIMRAQAKTGELSAVIARIEDAGFRVHLSEGDERTIVGVIGDGRPLESDQLERLPGVERCVPILEPFKLASRNFKPTGTTFPIGDHVVGSNEIVLMAGPCSVESRSQIIETAHAC